MIDYASQTDEELNEVAAARCGWTDENLVPLQWIKDHGEVDHLTPDYLRSLDACFSDYVPILRRRNYQIDLCFYFDDGTGLHKWIWTCDIADGDYAAYDSNPARAFTIAFLMATED